LTELYRASDDDLAAGLTLLGFSLSLDRITAKTTVDPGEIARAIEARNAARRAKNWKESDRIRDELLAKGIQLKDNPDGTTTWDVKR
jgi:cysteinyl-tRNA synthetase